mmetsp:Transcript_34990/g.80098  ORF Transcript_34990/g.80098 Transcript_34990/m.80098 type:complete len:332 (-) Transcript_34990:9-1004(-)
MAQDIAGCDGALAHERVVCEPPPEGTQLESDEAPERAGQESGARMLPESSLQDILAGVSEDLLQRERLRHAEERRRSEVIAARLREMQTMNQRSVLSLHKLQQREQQEDEQVSRSLEESRARRQASRARGVGDARAAGVRAARGSSVGLDTARGMRCVSPRLWPALPGGYVKSSQLRTMPDSASQVALDKLEQRLRSYELRHKSSMQASQEQRASVIALHKRAAQERRERWENRSAAAAARRQAEQSRRAARVCRSIRNTQERASGRSASVDGVVVWSPQLGGSKLEFGSPELGVDFPQQEGFAEISPRTPEVSGSGYGGLQLLIDDSDRQ